MNLRTREERVEWLKKGVYGYQIELSYIMFNDMIIERNNTLKEIKI